MPETTAARRTEGQAIAFLAFLGVLLAFAVDVSLPAFDELRTEFGLGEGSGEVSLVITTYLVGVAVGQLVWGPVADRFGRMPALLAGLSLYVVGAAGATAAPSMNTLLVARVVWGFGAASPALLRTTIARDLYDGDRMARIVAATLAVFLIGPAIAPAVGEAILFAGSWRYVFAAPIVVAVGAGIWALRFGETLDPDDRRPLELRSTLRAFRIVARTQASVGYIVAMTLTWGGFFVFLGSGQPIIDEIYGRGDWFAGYFAIASLGMAAASFSASRVTELFGAHRIIRFGLLITIGLSGMMTVAALL
ncbi:MAG: multidrug effflux MFS transporter, partial [Actinomycetia bacterium]|nr:multidrug effflux MFS transporter [Actinomycetes bacterium]